MLKPELTEPQAQHAEQTFDQIERDSDRDRWFTREQVLDWAVFEKSPAGGGWRVGAVK